MTSVPVNTREQTNKTVGILIELIFNITNSLDLTESIHVESKLKTIEYMKQLITL